MKIPEVDFGGGTINPNYNIASHLRLNVVVVGTRNKYSRICPSNVLTGAPLFNSVETVATTLDLYHSA